MNCLNHWLAFSINFHFRLSASCFIKSLKLGPSHLLSIRHEKIGPVSLLWPDTHSTGNEYPTSYLHCCMALFSFSTIGFCSCKFRLIKVCRFTFWPIVS